MSVFTALNHDQIRQYLSHYALGELVEFSGIATGVENSNYFLTLQQQNGEFGHYVLTLFERLSVDELPFFIALTTHLHARQCPVPCAVKTKTGKQLGLLADKPAVIVPKITGQHCESPSVAQCALIGTELARIHLAAEKFQPQPTNPRSWTWMQQAAYKLHPVLDDEQRHLLNAVLGRLQSFHTRKPALPTGIIHGDLFRDNVLFARQGIAAVLDFYNACQDDWLYDVAITANDWCIGTNGKLEQAKLQSLLRQYQIMRPFNEQEKACWPDLLLMAACRFWLSRLLDWHNNHHHPATNTLQPVTVKDPVEFQRIVEAHLHQPAGWALTH